MRNGSTVRRAGIFPVVLLAGMVGLSGTGAAASPFDGVYSGNFAAAAGSNPGCFGVDKTVRVVNGHFRQFFYYAPFSLNVAPDGTVAGSEMQTQTPRGGGRVVQLQGRIANGVLTIDYGNAVCRYHGELQRR